MEEKLIPVLLVSANVGSIFEDPQDLLKIWMKEFLKVIRHCQPKFLALHCQEVGGKNFKDSMRHVDEFVRDLMGSDELMHYNHMRIFLDEDFTCPETFTALGSLYFIHNSLQDVQIFDFHSHRFHPANGKEVYRGNIEHVGTKEKTKFPQDIFPESRSRKGVIRTRWRIGHTVFDLVNIHLFHDACNFIAMEEFPSKYTKTRQNALGYTLQRFSADPFEKAPFFIFGDFNFRLDMKGIVQKLTSQAVPVYVTSSKNGEIEKILYKDPGNDNKVVLTLEKKVFDFDKHQETFASNEKWLLEYDKELKIFEEELFEFDISFPPSFDLLKASENNFDIAGPVSYPYLEDACSGNSYMRTRCPSWCDRILLSRSALSLVNMAYQIGYRMSAAGRLFASITSVDSACPPVIYRLVGENVAMGDHKPVMLMFHLRQDKGTSHDKHVPPASSDKLHLILPRISVTFPTTKMPTTFSRFIHVKHPGSPARIFRETTV